MFKILYLLMFFDNYMVELPDVELLRCTLQTPIAINQSPVIREKAILLVKLMQHVEKRFPDEQELNAQFLELVNYIYR
jgi:hypothetical protein